jgi:hypothetical protein
VGQYSIGIDLQVEFSSTLFAVHVCIIAAVSSTPQGRRLQANLVRALHAEISFDPHLRRFPSVSHCVGAAGTEPEGGAVPRRRSARSAPGCEIDRFASAESPSSLRTVGSLLKIVRVLEETFLDALKATDIRNGLPAFQIVAALPSIKVACGRESRRWLKCCDGLGGRGFTATKEAEVRSLEPFVLGRAPSS